MGKGREETQSEPDPAPSPGPSLTQRCPPPSVRLTGDVNYTFPGTVSIKPPAHSKLAVDFLSVPHQTPVWQGCLNPATWRWIRISGREREPKPGKNELL